MSRRRLTLFLQPFLHDHQIEGTPVLPGVMGLEAFAEAAQCLVPGWHVAGTRRRELPRALQVLSESAAANDHRAAVIRKAKNYSPTAAWLEAGRFRIKRSRK
jgi:hypothetical protein